MKRFLINILAVLIIILSVNMVFAEKKSMSDTKKAQFGFGLTINSTPLDRMYKDYQAYKAIKHGQDFTLDYINSDEMGHINELSQDNQYAILFNNMVKSMEYGINFRFIYSILMVEPEILITPSNLYNNQSFQFVASALVGVRGPFFIMPYLLAGPTVTVNYYYNNFKFSRNPKTVMVNFADSFSFDVGMKIKAGVDLKFKYFSIGPYFTYNINSFSELAYLRTLYVENHRVTDEAKSIILQNAKFGIGANWYLGKKKAGK